MKNIQIVFFLCCFLLISFTSCNNSEVQQIQSQLSAAQEQISSLQEQLAQAKRQLAAEESSPPEASPENEDITFQQLKEDLIHRTDLIPVEAQLGGTFRYYEDTIKLLENHYVYAYAEDGHISVDMFLKYADQGDGVINWTLVAYDAGGGMTLN